MTFVLKCSVRFTPPYLPPLLLTLSPSFSLISLSLLHTTLSFISLSLSLSSSSYSLPSGFYEQSSFNCSRQDEITGESQWPEDLRTNSFFGVQINTSCIKELPKSGISLLSSPPLPSPLFFVSSSHTFM